MRLLPIESESVNWLRYARGAAGASACRPRCAAASRAVRSACVSKRRKVLTYIENKSKIP
eukprot:4399469-Pleurochrysis_carterae.AAC.6